jgi:serine phosphatase RsbU (regulator of sigma subunit)
MSCHYKGNWFYRTNHFDSAIFYDNKGIEAASKIKHYRTLIRCVVNLGNIANQRAEYSKAILYFQQAEQYSLLSHDTAGRINTAINQGNILFYINDFKQAKSSFIKAIHIASQSPNYKNELSNGYNNLGTVYLNTTPKMLDSAMYYFKLYLDLATELEDDKDRALAYYNMAEVYRNRKEVKEAELNYEKAQKLYEEIADTVGIMEVMQGKGDLYILQEKYKEAATVLQLGLKYSYEYDMVSNRCDFLKSLSQAYYKLNNYKEAYDYYYQGSLLSDSILNEDNAKVLYDLQTRYETNEKDKKNKLLEAENVISHKTIRQQQLVTYFIIGGLVLTLLLAFFIFRGLRQQRKANAIISEQKQEVQHQKEIIEEKQKEILDSIHYAKRIQDGLLEHRDVLNFNVKDSFIFFKPKDIVSGDFYWAYRKDHLFYLAVCDSTGHGVPGAFMSLLNMGFLYEAVNEKNISRPNEILDYTRERLIKSISKDGQKDGFDGILVCLDQVSGKLTYAAANNAPVLVSEGAMIEQKKNSMPVGKGERNESFELFSIEWKAGDVLYLYTDGYADQFGGPRNKKFKYKPLNEMLTAGFALPMEQQAAILDQRFGEWKGNQEQVDDVCIMGIRL